MKKSSVRDFRPDKVEPRVIRADAQRNREAILAAARDVFEEHGVLVSLDSISIRAGVGNATLYRNFPTRDDLLAAVMGVNLASILVTATALSEEPDPREALGEWLFRLTWELRIWHDLPNCVATAQSAPDSSLKSTNAALLDATGSLLAQARSAGVTIDTVTAEDLFELVLALSWGVDRFGDNEQAARRRVGLATAGIFRIATHPERVLTHSLPN
jgi:AcrR family transcriptional regulator